MTAVEWLIEQLEWDDSKIARVIGLKKYNQVVSQAKEMEKQQGYSEEEVIAFGEFIFKNTLLVNVKGVEGILKQFKNK